MNVLVAAVHGEDDDACVRILPAYHANGFEAAHPGKLQIHQRDIRPQCTEEGHRFLARRRSSNDFKVGLPVDNEGNAVAHDWMILNTQDADGGGRHGVQRSAGSGTAISMSVPMPIDDVIRTLPPTCSARSRIV